MYVIVDWHILSDGNPNSHKKKQKPFQGDVKGIKGYNNVIYEICNEPNNGTSWKEIKSYAKSVISTIREMIKSGDRCGNANLVTGCGSGSGRPN